MFKVFGYSVHLLSESSGRSACQWYKHHHVDLQNLKPHRSAQSRLCLHLALPCPAAAGAAAAAAAAAAALRPPRRAAAASAPLVKLRGRLWSPRLQRPSRELSPRASHGLSQRPGAFTRAPRQRLRLRQRGARGQRPSERPWPRRRANLTGGPTLALAP